MNRRFVHTISLATSPADVVLRVVEHSRGASASSLALASEVPQPAPPPDHDFAELKELLTNITQQIKKELAQLRAAQIQAAESLQDATIELAMLVAEHVVQSKIDASEFDLGNIVGAAIQELLPAETISVYLHPEDVRLFSDSLAEEWATLRQEAELREDPALPRGTCRVANEQHALLSSPAIRLQNARESLNQALGYDNLDD